LALELGLQRTPHNRGHRAVLTAGVLDELAALLPVDERTDVDALTRGCLTLAHRGS
jgi:hypothetical protein